VLFVLFVLFVVSESDHHEATKDTKERIKVEC